MPEQGDVEVINPEVVQGYASRILDWLMANVFTLGSGGQIAVIIVTWIVAYFAGRWLKKAVFNLLRAKSWFKRTEHILNSLYKPLIWLGLLAAVMFGFHSFDLPAHVLRIAVSLLSAWIVIRVVSNFVRNREMARLVALIAWTVAALNILGLLAPTITFLDGLAMKFGENRISALSVLKGIIMAAILIWGAMVLSRFSERQFSKSDALTPSMKVLFGKVVKFLLVAVAFILALAAAGVDLTALAVFGGAVGVGLGFGLQKVVSNLISGLILLMDRSIKPGDVIEVGETYGWINSLAARYTSVITRDGTEHLIPNEDIITQRVTNWTHSHSKVRRKIPVGVAYWADIHLAMDLIIEAANETRRVLDDPEPRVLVREFGDSSVNLELRIWISDPQNGVSNVQSDVMIRVWDKFHDHGITIPFPQRDIHIVSADGLAETYARPANFDTKRIQPKPEDETGDGDDGDSDSDGDGNGNGD